MYAYADRRVPAPRHCAVHENNDGMDVSSHLQPPEHFLLIFLVVLHDQGRLEEPGPLVKSRLQLLEEVALLRLSGVFQVQLVKRQVYRLPAINDAIYTE